MHPTYATEVSDRQVRRLSPEGFISLLGPLTVAGGVIWAILQPWRLTLLHPLHHRQPGLGRHGVPLRRRDCGHAGRREPLCVDCGGGAWAIGKGRTYAECHDGSARQNNSFHLCSPYDGVL